MILHVVVVVVVVVVRYEWHLFYLGLYRICFWEIWPELDYAGFVKQIRPEPVPEPDFTI